MAAKDTPPQDRPLGTVGGGRFYRPPSVAPVDEEAPETVGPEGRFYTGDAPIEQASEMAGEPPTKDDVRAAKAEAKAVEAGTVEPADPAAETVQSDPVAAAGELAGEPPASTVVKPDDEPAGNASRDDWAAYARSKGAVDEDLVDEDGKDLGRDALRDKYATPTA